MGGRWAIRRSDDQLMELIDSTGSWSVNDQRGTLLLCRVRTLREAVERVMLYQVLKQDVGAVCWETRENIIIFGRQSQRLATKIRRRAACLGLSHPCRLMGDPNSSQRLFSAWTGGAVHLIRVPGRIYYV